VIDTLLSGNSSRRLPKNKLRYLEISIGDIDFLPF
jgi:hypothetical protein